MDGITPSSSPMMVRVGLRFDDGYLPFSRAWGSGLG